jgi:hypothetical protein
VWHAALPSFPIGFQGGLEAGLEASSLVATLIRAEARDGLGAVMIWLR